MTDVFTEVISKSLFGRLADSIKGILFGLVLFFGSFILLFWNEYRAVQTSRALAEGASLVISAEAGEVNPANEGKLVHVSGRAVASEMLTDSYFRVSATALKLNRVAKMYQWVEHQKSQTHGTLGGGEEKSTTYTYQKEWREKWTDSSSFKVPTGHFNPAKSVESTALISQQTTLGAYKLSPGFIKKIDDAHPWSPDPVPSMESINGFRRAGMGFYKGINPDDPQVGDIEVTFTVVEPQEVSVIGQQVAGGLGGYLTKAGQTLEMVELGDQSAGEMFKEARDQNTKLTWTWRVVGMLAMWFGIRLFLEPLKVVADVVPFLGNIAMNALSVGAAMIAAPLSLLTIAVAWFLFRPLLSVGLMAGGLAVGYGLWWLVDKKQKAAAPEYTSSYSQ